MRNDRRSAPLLLLGLLLLAVGGLLSSATSSHAYLPRLLLVSGGASLLYGLVLSVSALRLFLFRLRSVAEPGPVMTWFLLALFLILLAIGFDLKQVRFDLTARGLNSLSAPSREALASLSRPIELIGVYREDDPARDLARDILEVYRSGSGRIRTRLLDPDREPAEARRLGIRFSSGILVGADSVHETVMDLSESALTQAIVRAGDPVRPMVGLLVGHGEDGPGHAGWTKLRHLLAEGGVGSTPLRLAEFSDVPPGIRSVLVIGPTSRLLPGEEAALGRFLDRAGRLGVFIDPGETTGLEDLLLQRGVVVDGKRIRDDGPLARSVGLGPETIPVHSFAEHAITKGLTAGVILPGATRVGLTPAPIWGTNATEILKSEPGAALEGEAAGASGGGPGVGSARNAVLPLGVALSWEVPPRAATPQGGIAAAGSLQVPEKPFARIVAVGDSDLLRDDAIDLYGNREFASRIAGWLTEREFLLKFPPPDQSGTPLRIGLSGLRTLLYLVELLIPMAMIGLGIRTWMRRR